MSGGFSQKAQFLKYFGEMSAPAIGLLDLILF